LNAYFLLYLLTFVTLLTVTINVSPVPKYFFVPPVPRTQAFQVARSIKNLLMGPGPRLLRQITARLEACHPRLATSVILDGCHESHPKLSTTRYSHKALVGSHLTFFIRPLMLLFRASFARLSASFRYRGKPMPSVSSQTALSYHSVSASLIGLAHLESQCCFRRPWKNCSIKGVGV